MERIESKKGYVFTQSGDVDKEQRFFTKAIWVDENYPKENFIEVTDVERRAWENDSEYSFANPNLAALKKAKVNLITDYDVSNAVNEFTYNGQSMWIEFDLRKNITHDIKVLKAKNIDEFTFWFNGTPMTFPIGILESLLVEIEIYALKCFNVTAQHKADVEALKTVEEVLNYDFTVGYPSKLNFEL